jgi:hypothetical protein
MWDIERDERVILLSTEYSNLQENILKTNLIASYKEAAVACLNIQISMRISYGLSACVASQLCGFSKHYYTGRSI